MYGKHWEHLGTYTEKSAFSFSSVKTAKRNLSAFRAFTDGKSWMDKVQSQSTITLERRKRSLAYTSCRLLVVKNIRMLSKDLRPKRSLNARLGHSKLSTHSTRCLAASRCYTSCLGGRYCSPSRHESTPSHWKATADFLGNTYKPVTNDVKTCINL